MGLNFTWLIQAPDVKYNQTMVKLKQNRLPIQQVRNVSTFLKKSFESKQNSQSWYLYNQ
jgi:hypothetical protein